MSEATGDDARPRRGRDAVRMHRTIHDVARLADVSIGTASKALNGSGQLRAETRARVIAAANTLGFRPNDLAHSLHRGQSLTVGVISNDNFGRFSMPIVAGLEQCLAEQSISVFMCNATDDPEREAWHVAALLGRRVDGIVVTARRADGRPRLRLPSPGVPVIYVFSQSDDPEALSLVPDDFSGARLATEHLVRLGRRRIAHATGPERFEAVRLRRDGYLAALRDAGLPAPANRYLPGAWSEAWGRDAAARLLAAAEPPDAIFCGNDQIARGVADALRDSNVLVPQAVAIVGFDNWEIVAAATRPPLTTIDMNLGELGREAGRRLTDIMGGKRPGGVHRLPCSLVVRDSCGYRQTGG
jgi:LacI family transcriptional regulator, galactose operon repressor